MVTWKKIIVPFILALIAFPVFAQEPSARPFILVTGEVSHTVKLFPEDIAAFPRHKATLIDRDGKSTTYSGASLQQVLESAGVTMGKSLRGEQLTKYLLVKCADGYKLVFSLAEIDSSFTDKMIIVADRVDDGPLPAGKGPFRLVVPGEKKNARSSYQVTEFIIRFAKD